MMSYQRAASTSTQVLTVIVLFGFMALSGTAAEHEFGDATDAAINGKHRSAESKAREKYPAIGESDRLTMKFVKPAAK